MGITMHVHYMTEWPAPVICIEWSKLFTAANVQNC